MTARLLILTDFIWCMSAATICERPSLLAETCIDSEMAYSCLAEHVTVFAHRLLFEI